MFTKQQNGSLNNNNNNNNYEMQKDLLLIIDAEIQNTKVEKTTTSTKYYAMLHYTDYITLH